MYKRLFISIFFSLRFLFLFAQGGIDYCQIQFNSFGSGNCADDCLGGMSVTDIANMPIVNFNVDFHFVRSNGSQFQCDNPGAPYYAPDYVNALLGTANDYFTNPSQNQFGTSPALIDTRFRYRLYGSPANPCDAIFLHDQDPTSFTNPSALHIVIKDCGSTVTGQMFSENIIAMYGIYKLAFDDAQDPQSIGSQVSSTINHEIGHRFGLCHAFSIHNDCPDMNTEAECGMPSETQCSTGALCPATPGANTCGGDVCWKCFCTFGTGNNFMGYTNNRRGITRSQWAKIYKAATTEMPDFVTVDFASTCVDVPPQAPLIIPTGIIEEWTSLRIINQVVEVQTGATLIIRCEVRMGKELPIIVNRGARLFVLGGTVTSQSPNCLWEGILVHGNATEEQPSVADAKDEFVPLNAADAGVVWLNGAVISNAITGVSTKASGSLDNHAHYGGLIMAYACDFINNGRAVEFMKYGKSNKSYFKFVEVEKVGTTAWLVNRGVSIWGCHDIEFDNVHFANISDYGIRGINFSVKVKNCTFEGVPSVGFGFLQESTMPNAAKSDTKIDEMV
jgi:hypothetical protein